MSAIPKKKTAPVASEGGQVSREFRPQFSTPTTAELQERHLQALGIIADWRADLDRERLRLELRAELIGGVDEEEVEEHRAEVELFKRCCRVLSWRPTEEVKP
jgi:hypothetical protein